MGGEESEARGGDWGAVMGHGVVKCGHCLAVIRQCRCPDHREVTYERCAACVNVQPPRNAKSAPGKRPHPYPCDCATCQRWKEAYTRAGLLAETVDAMKAVEVRDATILAIRAQLNAAEAEHDAACNRIVDLHHKLCIALGLSTIDATIDDARLVTEAETMREALDAAETFIASLRGVCLTAVHTASEDGLTITISPCGRCTECRVNAYLAKGAGG